MDKRIEKSINRKRDALYAHYDLPDYARQKVEALFERMEQFGRRCRDLADFEEKFATLTLNREYNNLFVEFTAYVKSPEDANKPQQQVSRNAISGVRSVVLRLFGKQIRSLRKNSALRER